jgi:hypothetical protein
MTRLLKIAIATCAIAVTSVAAEPGRVIGIMNAPEGVAIPGTTVWLVTKDCRTSYREKVDATGRFMFNAVPPGTYTLVGYCFTTMSRPVEEFRVEPGRTNEVKLEMWIPSFDGPGIPKGVAPFNGRIIDEAGHPIVGATVKDSNASPDWPGWVSGDDGRFGECRMGPGKLSLVITHPDYRARKLHLSVGIFNYSDGHLEIKLRKR